MKSKYAPLVRLKKEKLEEAKRTVLQANLKIQKLQEKIQTVKSDLNAQRKPMAGSLRDYNQYVLLTNAYRNELERTKDQLATSFHYKNVAQSNLNKAMIEFEKFQYLKAQEEQAYMKKLKREEALYLDEVAVIGYNLQEAKK